MIWRCRDSLLVGLWNVRFLKRETDEILWVNLVKTSSLSEGHSHFEVRLVLSDTLTILITKTSELQVREPTDTPDADCPVTDKAYFTDSILNNRIANSDSYLSLCFSLHFTSYSIMKYCKLLSYRTLVNVMQAEHVYIGYTGVVRYAYAEYYCVRNRGPKSRRGECECEAFTSPAALASEAR